MKRLNCCLAIVLLLNTVACMKQGENVASGGAAPPGAAAAVDATPRETINQKTQNVLDLDQALADGAVLASTQATESDPLLQSAAVFRTTVGKLGGMAVQQAIQLRNAQSIQDPKPLTHAQFMSEIIKQDQPDGIQLAMLPYYQEYAWDSKNQSLVVVEFPARKAERQKQLDSN